MRILFFNYEYPPLGGGAANATAYLLREYAKIKDLKIDLVTSSTNSQYQQEKIGENIIIHKLPIGKNKENLHFQSQKELLVYSYKAYFFSKKLIKKNQYYLTHSFFSIPCGLLSLLFKWQFDIPFIISLRGADVPGYAERFTWIYKILTPLIKFIWKKADKVVANSQGLKDLALKTNPQQKIEIIYNGIDTEKFQPLELSKISNDIQEKFIITSGASRITSRKGLKYLLQSVQILSQKYPRVYLEIMGDGDQKSELEKLAQDLKINERVKFFGRIPREKTVQYYQRASVFVLPSFNEGMSNAMLEALATGLPIIATKTGGAEELIMEGKNGFIIKMKNAKDIAQKLEKIIRDNHLQKTMRENSRSQALSLSWKEVARKYTIIYKNII